LAHAPTISDILTICGSGGAVVGAVLGFLAQAGDNGGIAENVSRGTTIGFSVGVLIGFLVYAAKLGGV
jgi:hypothetical protein